MGDEGECKAGSKRATTGEERLSGRSTTECPGYSMQARRKRNKVKESVSKGAHLVILRDRRVPSNAPENLKQAP